MSSSDDDTPSSWIPLSQRPEWQDLQPVAQPDSLHPVVAIKYTTQAEEVLSYFRAVRAAKELSSRALALTQEVNNTAVCELFSAGSGVSFGWDPAIPGLGCSSASWYS